jgi:hypothetical protein
MDFKNTLLLTFCAFMIAFTAQAQDLKFPDLDASPMDQAHYPRESAYLNYMGDAAKDLQPKIKVLYCRPQKKEREIFGGLVPYGKEWRLGANEATEVTFYQNVEIGGSFVPAGTYTIFANVNPSSWDISVSKERFIAGTSNRKKDMDVAHATIAAKNVSEGLEAFTIGFQKINDGKVHMVFHWDHTRAALPINLNPAYMDGELNASPMDLVQYPANSRFRNFAKDEADYEARAPKIRVVFSRPQKKDRDVFGGLLKYGELWRVGANETTIITFFEDVMIGGKEIKAGKYGLTAKVNEGSWDFIVHKNINSWGHYNHDESTNVVTVNAKTAKTPSTVEAMSIILEEKDAKNVNIIVAWDDTMAKLPVQLK